MIYRLNEIEERVYTLLDENRAILDDRTAYGDPSASLRSMIRELTPEAAREVIMEAEPSEINECDRLIEGAMLRHIDESRAQIELPLRFLRLFYLKMTDWDQGVYQTLEPSSIEYQLYARSLQEEGEFGLRSHPAVAVGMGGGSRTLEIFNTGPTSAIEAVRFVCEPSFDGVEIDLPQSLYPRICRKIAAFIAEITAHKD